MSSRDAPPPPGPPAAGDRTGADAAPIALAHRLHSAAIHLLRLVRQVDIATDLGPAQLSALSVLVFGGPRSLGALAAAEQVRPPSMSRVVHELEAAGFVRRRPDASDARTIRLEATAKGRRLMLAGRERRAALLASFLDQLSPPELVAIAGALPAIEAAIARGRETVSRRAESGPDRRASRGKPGGAWRRSSRAG